MNMPNQNVKITFQDPTAVRNDHEIALWLDALREYPMAWAKYDKRVSPNVRTQINKGNINGISEGEFEAVCRNYDKRGTKNATCDMFVRYLGDKGKKLKDRKGAVLDCGCWFHAMPGQKIGEKVICQNHDPQKMSKVIKCNVGENAWKNL